MKNIIILTLVSAFQIFFCYASVPISWTVETSRLAPAVFDVVRGETIDLEATFNSSGKPFAVDTEPVSIFWQTNGMESAWWTAPAAATSNRVSATFTPEMDPGAATVNGFLGSSGSIYRAAFTFRFRHGPGATPNVLPLPTPVIDFAKVLVLNPPWEGGGVNTNAVIDIIHETVSGSARSLPKYLHLYDANDSYPAEAAEYYRQRGSGVPAASCSSVRDGGFLYRNFDYPFDDRAEFVVKMSAGPNRFASVGVAQVGTNLTEQMVTSGKPEFSARYKWLPGATVDGINEHGVVAEINVVDTPVTGWHTTGNLHPLAAIRWILDHATNAQHAATYIAANIRFPAGWTQNFHYMIADAEKTYIVENGTVTDGDEYHEPDEPVTMTNFQLSKFPWDGMGMERFGLLLGGANITNAWYTRAYHRSTNPPWVSDLKDVIAYTNEIFDAWASHPKEYFRNKTTNGQPWWQTVHTSIYDIMNRVLRVAVQETDDWYTFQVPVSGGLKVETDPVWSAEKSGYQPKISDLDAIRAGAAAGATAYQKPSGGIPKSDLAAGVKESLGKADTALQSFTEKDPTVGLTNGTIHIKGQAITPITSFTEQDPTATAKANAAIAAAGCVRTNSLGEIEVEGVFATSRGLTATSGPGGLASFYGDRFTSQSGTFYLPWCYDFPHGSHPDNEFALLSDIPDASGFVPYTGANQDVDLGHFNIMSYGFAYFYAFNANGTDYQADSIYSSSGQYWLPWADDYGVDPTHDFALVSQIEAATNALAQTIPQKINAAVSANLNTYIDGETGVEYVGKFYGDSFYYVPTGNVYPPNN